jgi:hypothetical protein
VHCKGSSTLVIDTSQKDEGLKYIPKFSKFIEKCGLLLLDNLKTKALIKLLQYRNSFNLVPTLVDRCRVVEYPRLLLEDLEFCLWRF